MKFSCSVLIFWLLSLLSSVVIAEEPDWSNYNKLLSQYVKPGQINHVKLMKVDYLGIKHDAVFKELVSQIANFDINKLSNQKEKLAFYINAYNILAIKVVIDHWPVKSIKDVGSFFSPVWKVDAGKINHQLVSLHEVEHEILRKMGEPRIHMAIVCASVSCPDLRSEAYTAKKIDQQLDEQSNMFLANTRKGLYIKNNTAYVSKIFDWFEADFNEVGGVRNYIRQYNSAITASTKIEPDIQYNWQLNKQ